MKGLMNFLNKISNMKGISYADGKKIIENLFLANDPSLTRRR